MTAPAQILIAVVLALGAVCGAELWAAHLTTKGYTQGAQAMRTIWETVETQRLADEARARLQAEAAARKSEQAKQKETERIAHEQAQREATLRAAVAAADARQRSLHTTIAQLNADAAARLSGTGSPACTAADVDAAATARELLGACSDRYATVAGAADELAGQVTGLQDYVQAIALEGVQRHDD